MRFQIKNLICRRFGFLLKSSALLSLILVCLLVAACGPTTTTAQIPGNPVVTITINPNQTFASPTPKLPSYTCGAWVTNTSPAYSKNGVVPVYAYYKHLVGGNPVGMPNASAVATVLWPFSAPENFNTTTSSDGLAVFMVNMQASAIGHVTLISVAFTSFDSKSTCNITGADDAFFTINPAAAPPVQKTAVPTPPTRHHPFATPTNPPGLPGQGTTPTT